MDDSRTDSSRDDREAREASEANAPEGADGTTRKQPQPEGSGPVERSRTTSRPRPPGEVAGHTVQPWEQPRPAGPARTSPTGPPASGDEATPKSPGAKDVPHPSEGADEARTVRATPSAKPLAGYHGALDVAPGQGADRGGFPKPEPQQAFAAKLPEGAGAAMVPGAAKPGQVTQAIAANLAKAVRPAVVEALGEQGPVDKVCRSLADHMAQWLHQSVVQAMQGGTEEPAPRPPGVRPGMPSAPSRPRPDSRQLRKDRATAEVVGGGDPQGPPPPRARTGPGGAEAA